MLFQLIYTCAFTHVMSPSELEAIAKDARLRNIERGITGILLCTEGSVLQVLEGKKSAVLELYQIITTDERVSSALMMIKRDIKEREFSDWSMGYKNAGECEAVFALCAQTLPEVLPVELSPEVNTIGRTFARVNGII